MSVSSIIVAVNTTDVWPAGIITTLGTCNSVRSLEVRLTTIFDDGAALDVIVPSTEPSPSVTAAGKIRPSVAVSLSATTTISEPVTYPGAEAVIVAGCGPSSKGSSTIVMLKFVVVWPASTVTDGGTVTWEVAVQDIVKVTFVAAGEKMLICPDSVPSPSVALCGTVRTIGKAHGP